MIEMTSPSAKTTTATASSRQRTQRPLSLSLSRQRIQRFIAMLLILVGLWYFQTFSYLSNWRAEQHLKVDHFDRAENALDWSLFFRDRNPETYRLRARLNRKLGQYDLFSENLEQFAQLGGDPLQARREEILARASGGEAPALMEELVKMLKNQEGDADEVCSAFANGFLVGQEYNQAFVVIENWKQSYPEDPRPHYTNGRVQDYLQNDYVAEQEYRDALAKCESHYPSAFALGRLLLETQHPQEAIKFFSRCLAMKKNGAAKVEIGKCYRQLGETEKAREVLEEAMNLPIDELMASYLLIQEIPAGNPAAFELGSLELGAGNNEAALKFLNIAYEADPSNLDVRYARAIALRQSGATEAGSAELQAVNNARTALQKADKIIDGINPVHPYVEERLQVGELYLNNGSLKTAEFWLKSVLAYEPTSIRAHELLSELYTRKAKRDSLFLKEAEYHSKTANRLSAIQQNTTPTE
ncbi:tetratricopeptide repeat protein [Thalassoglobus polymorphus]|nr:tetratricopeptide repeat protein [Thalassoglobus polymorphus]